MRHSESFPRNGTMAWRAVLLRAAEPDRNRSEQALAAVLLWAAFWLAVGAVVLWWATAKWPTSN